MLSELRQFLKQRNDMVSLRELAIHFDREEAVIAGMLSHWQRKGMVEHIDASCAQACGGCDRGSSGGYYRWSGNGGNRISLVCPKG
ncbi:FeoC-like transcriptional regulator [Parendozoicomonas haliclonae]|uniref:FeoC like transcriptional regulator n=1 Tax=Parendozoicomonas haliclonae TaxID=1960125 RepID=A0A1X7ARS4_9GAMM|nr:FeoC-like transcriptional regulator [Parendozoicomonas haliclonae]SMA50935.1 FeoC like transcriptional regulator [Parendozoicomonas haliclonae]